jgi:hypothetical protein
MDDCPRCKKFAEAYQLAVMPERFLGENPKAVGVHTIFVCTRVQKRGDSKTNWTGHTASGDVVLLQRLAVQPRTMPQTMQQTPHLFDSIRRKPMRDVLMEGLFFMDEETEATDAELDRLCQNSHVFAKQTMAC